MKKIMLICGMLLLMSIAMYSQIRTLDDVRDQVMLNTARLNAIEEHLREVVGNDSRLGVIEVQMMVLQRMIEGLAELVYGILAFAFLQTFGLAVMGVKLYIQRKDKREPI